MYVMWVKDGLNFPKVLLNLGDFYYDTESTSSLSE